MAKLNLSPEAKAAKAAYQKAWSARNREKVHKYLENYWERKAAELNTPQARARELAANGHTQREIAEIMGISLGRVNAYLNSK